MTGALRIGIAGLGTVGIGVLKIFAAHAAMLEARAARPIAITAVSARNRNRMRGIDINPFTWFDDPLEMAASEELDVVVELIGGSEGIAKDLVETAIANRKHIVTANKALVARHGISLAFAAEANGISLAYEAAVAGGIPIVKALREGLSANQVDRLYGILNGTCNYILTAMTETGRDFSDVLLEAQNLGYAESDPTFDIGMLNDCFVKCFGNANSGNIIMSWSNAPGRKNVIKLASHFIDRVDYCFLDVGYHSSFAYLYSPLPECF